MSAVPLLEVPELAGEGWVHGFTTRTGGCSEGPLASLNLARRPGEEDARLEENWRRALGALGAGFAPADVALLSQVHGPEVARVTAPSGWDRTLGAFDAAVTTTPGVVLAVRAADCVPVLFAAEGVVGVAHAGWRGAACGVIPRTLEALRALGAQGIRAGIGPSISGARYEVGLEVVEALEASGVAPEVFVVERRGAKAYVDVGAAVAAQLAAGGVERIGRIRRCTHADPELFSHREDPRAGRQVGLIALA
ncbi:MAG: polyphenol oxidase family protein [Planctomycetota bacterium]